VDSLPASESFANRILLGLIHEDLARIAQALDRNTALLQSIARKLGEGQAEYLSINQAATVAGLSATKIRREVKAGRLPASNTGTFSHAHYRIARTDLQAWMEQNRGGSQVPPAVPTYEPKGKSRHFPGL
jgi:excisionase family DNA binding protein